MRTRNFEQLQSEFLRKKIRDWKGTKMFNETRLDGSTAANTHCRRNIITITRTISLFTGGVHFDSWKIDFSLSIHSSKETHTSRSRCFRRLTRVTDRGTIKRDTRVVGAVGFSISKESVRGKHTAFEGIDSRIVEANRHSLSLSLSLAWW